MKSAHYNVVIAGGGLAGMTLALQLKQTDPGLDVVVLERNQNEPPDAAFKVGESTVEIGAHYLAKTLGLESILEKSQLRKFGLRFFFAANGNDLAEADELGASDYFGSPTYQIDRGRFERDLFEHLQQTGVEAHRGAVVYGLDDLDEPKPSQVKVRTGSGEHSVSCDWFIDASGRASVLRKKKSLERPHNHATCSAWFRVDREIDVDQWSNNETWQKRNPGGGRLLSTNHLMGAGYWVWIIPLSGGRTSIGLVSDSDILPLEQYNSVEKFLQWAKEHHPLLAESMSEANCEPMDFKYLPVLARDSKQIWSSNGWAFTGESAVFADPFYSPGTDYIALANTFITRFVCSDESPEQRHNNMRFCHALFRSFFAGTMSLYRGQYGGFGDARLMAVKSTWDYVYYWSVLAWLYFHGRTTDVEFLKRHEHRLQGAFSLNNHMQAQFRQYAAQQRILEPRARFFDQQAIPILGELNQGLLAASGQDLVHNCERMALVARELEQLLQEPASAPSQGRHSEFLGDLALRLV